MPGAVDTLAGWKELLTYLLPGLVERLAGSCCPLALPGLLPMLPPAPDEPELPVADEPPDAPPVPS